MYELKKIVGSLKFSVQFLKIISNYKKIGYNINVLQQIVCLVVNPITVGNFAFLFNCTQVGPTSDSMMVQTYLLMRWYGPDTLAVVSPTRVYLLDFFAPVFSFMYC